LPDHLRPASLRAKYVVDAAQLRAVLRDETSPRLRRVVELLASERIDREGVGRVAMR
jgi:hypothetical protein